MHLTLPRNSNPTLSLRNFEVRLHPKPEGTPLTQSPPTTEPPNKIAVNKAPK